MENLYITEFSGCESKQGGIFKSVPTINSKQTNRSQRLQGTWYCSPYPRGHRTSPSCCRTGTRSAPGWRASSRSCRSCATSSPATRRRPRPGRGRGPRLGRGRGPCWPPTIGCCNSSLKVVLRLSYFREDPKYSSFDNI